MHNSNSSKNESNDEAPPDWAESPSKQSSSSILEQPTSSILPGRKKLIPKSNKRDNSGNTSNEEDEEDDDLCCGCALDPILCWFRLFHILSLLIGGASFAANIYVLIKTDGKTFDFKDMVMRIYTLMFCVIIVFTGKNR